MKKYIILSAILISGANVGFAAPEFINNTADIENAQRRFYESPMGFIPTVEVVEKIQRSDYSSSMPLFKKVRVRVTNYWHKVTDVQDEKQAESEKKRLERKSDPLDELDDNFNEKPVAKKEVNIPEPELKAAVSDTSETSEESEKTLELSSGIKENVAPKEAQLDAAVLNYDNETEEMEALGRPILTFIAQNTTLQSDRIIYNTAANIVKAYGDVEITKDGLVSRGDYMQINMNEENAYIDNLRSKIMYSTITAEKAIHENDKLTLENGKITVDENYTLKLRTQMIYGLNYDNMLIDPIERSFINDTVDPAELRLKVKNININAKKEHDIFSFKDIGVHYSDTKLFKIPRLTLHTNKHQDYVEGNYPEFGSRSNIGMFAGPGFVFDLPHGATVKAIPFINQGDKFGVGAALKYRSATNYTDFMYGSANNMFVMSGKQKLDDKLSLQYGMNSYMDNWFLGYLMPKYMVEACYEDSTVIKNSLGEGLNLHFRHRAAAGWMQDMDENRSNEQYAVNNTSTMRYRYMAELDQSFFRRENIAERKVFDIGVMMQGSATVYGTGDTQFIGRAGPRMHTQYKNWMQDVGFLMSAYQDGTPMPIFDAYRYGHSAMFFREALRVNKYITLAWAGTVNLSNDSPNGKTFQESGFFVSVGPDDFKFNLGYDVVRKQTFFTVALAMNMKGSSVEYETMEIKNLDRLSMKESDPKIIYFENKKYDKPISQKLKYAQVIDIEDPDKEKI